MPFRGVAQVVACLVRDQEAAGSSPATPTTSEQSPLCSDFFLAYGKKEVIRPLPCSSFSAKGHARLACSVASALTTARGRYHPFAGAGPHPALIKLTNQGLEPFRAPGPLFCPRFSPASRAYQVPPSTVPNHYLKPVHTPSCCPPSCKNANGAAGNRRRPRFPFPSFPLSWELPVS